MRSLLVDDVMRRDVIAVGPDTALGTVAGLFATHGFSGLPVLDERGRAMGVISKTDLVIRERRPSSLIPRPVYYRVWNGEISAVGTTLTDGDHPTGVVEELMSPFVLTVSAGAPLVDAARLMCVEHVHRLLVLSERQVIGILTSLDCLRALLAPPRIELAGTPREDAAAESSS